jgi:hypothetical protein
MPGFMTQLVVVAAQLAKNGSDLVTRTHESIAAFKDIIISIHKENTFEERSR